MIFSGGLSYDKACRRPSLTIMHGKAITVLEMDHPIVDFLTLCETPYPNGELIKQNRIIESINESNFSNIRIPVWELPFLQLSPSQKSPITESN